MPQFSPAPTRACRWRWSLTRPSGSSLSPGWPGNIVTAEIIASLEYAVAVLGTHTILVMGHSRCGAVTAAIQASTQAQPGPPVPGQISALFPYIEPAVKQAGPDLEATVRANALLQAARLRESPLLAPMIEEGKLMVAAGYFDIRSGAVTVLDAARNVKPAVTRISCRADRLRIGCRRCPGCVPAPVSPGYVDSWY